MFTTVVAIRMCDMHASGFTSAVGRVTQFSELAWPKLRELFGDQSPADAQPPRRQWCVIIIIMLPIKP
jgi:hypothetical protein